MSEPDLDYRMAEKRWRRRNSDMRDTWEGERSAPPPARLVEEHELPMTEDERPAGREEPGGVAERHVHAWGVEDAE